MHECFRDVGLLFFCNQIVMPHPFLPILLHILQASTRYNADYKLSDLSCTQITLLHGHEQFFRSIAIIEQIIGQIIDSYKRFYGIGNAQ